MSPAPGSAELVTYAARLVRVVGRAAATESPVTLRLLSQLDELGPVTVTDLAKADRTTQPTTSAAIQGLESRGLVTRVANPGDARSTLLVLTPAGKDELVAARRRHAEILDRLVADHGVDPADLSTAVAVLRRLSSPLSEK